MQALVRIPARARTHRLCLGQISNPPRHSSSTSSFRAMRRLSSAQIRPMEPVALTKR